MSVIYTRSCEYEYPIALEKILNYLKSHGKLYISDDLVESYYRGFSDHNYSVPWVGVSDKILEEFELYLETIT